MSVLFDEIQNHTANTYRVCVSQQYKLSPSSVSISYYSKM